MAGKRGRPKKGSKSPAAEMAGSEITPEKPVSKSRRPVQTEIPGTERPNIKEIDSAAEDYVNLRDKMQTAVKEFKVAKTLLSGLMHKHAETLSRNGEGALIYTYSDMQVILAPKEETLKVKHVDPEDEALEVGKAPEDESEGTA